MEQDLGNQLIHSIFKFRSLAGSGLGMDSAENKSALNMTELILMNQIVNNTEVPEGNVGLSDIRRYLSISKAAVSQMLGSLEKKGFINREIDRNNRRSLIVTLTSEGRKVLEQQYNGFSDRLERIIGCLGEDDVKHMITIINRMVEITNELNAETKLNQGETTMTLHETIFARRQVRKFNNAPLDKKTLENILKCVSDAEQLSDRIAEFEITSAEAVRGGGSAPYYLLSYCDNNSAAYANVGFILQKVDLYIQSIGLGSGWFASVKPKDNGKNHCIALAFGNTDTPVRKGPEDFKRQLVEEISNVDNTVARAVQLAPSAMNSQPWKLEFADKKVVIKDAGRGLMRAVLRNKLNKIDIGIAARHAVVALEQEGRKVTCIIPKETRKEFEIEILYE